MLCVPLDADEPMAHSGPYAPYETNYSDGCRRNDAGLSGCKEIVGLNSDPPEHNHARKGVPHEHSMLCHAPTILTLAG